MQKKSKKKSKLYLVVFSFLLAIVFLMAYLKIEKDTHKTICSIIGYLQSEEPELASKIINMLYDHNPKKTWIEEAKSAFSQNGYGMEGMRYLDKLYENSFIFIILFIGALSFVFVVYVHANRKNRILENEIKQLIFCAEAMDEEREPKKIADGLSVPCIWELYEQLMLLAKKLEYKKNENRKENEKAQILIENISHQVRTPLTGLSLNLEIIEEESHSELSKDKIQSGYQQIAHIQNLMNCLLKTGQMERGKVIFHFEMTEISELMKEVILQVKEVDGNRKILFSDYIEKNYLAVDFLWMKEAFYNIIHNCILYSPQDTPITIAAIKKESKVQIVIKDQGIGIDPGELPFIFDRFYRCDKNRSQDGFGIGLNMAKLVLEAHHGTILASSSEKGSCFTITL